MKEGEKKIKERKREKKREKGDKGEKEGKNREKARNKRINRLRDRTKIKRSHTHTHAQYICITISAEVPRLSKNPNKMAPKLSTEERTYNCIVKLGSRQKARSNTRK